MGITRLLDQAEITRFYTLLSHHIPTPETELTYSNPYTLLVAVVLSAQATDKGVNKATPSLFALADTPQKMVELGEERVRELLSSLNFYRTKAKNVVALSQILIEKYDSQIPSTREELESLPGVGRKTANVVLNVAFGKATIPVDTHVFRVANRTGLAAGKTPLAVEQQLEARTPGDFLSTAHHLLILHGRYTCKAAKPLCTTCVVHDVCKWEEKQ